MQLSPRAIALLLAPALVVLTAFLVLPLLQVLRLSLLQGGSVGLPTETIWTLANYARLLADPFYLKVLGRTLLLAAIVTVTATLLGYPLAHAIWRAPQRWRGALTVFALSPLLVSIVVTSYGWLVLLGNQGLVNQSLIALGVSASPLKLIHNDVGIVIGLTHILLPFVVLSVLAALDRIDPRVIEAAAVLGATRWRCTREVVLPLAVPGLIAGTTLAFSAAVSAYVTPALLGGSGANFIGTAIFNQFMTVFNWPFGATLACALLIVAALVVYVYLRAVSRIATAHLA